MASLGDILDLPPRLCPFINGLCYIINVWIRWRCDIHARLQLQGNERKTLFYTILAVAQPSKRRKATRMIGAQRRHLMYKSKEMLISWINIPRRLCPFSHLTQNVIITNRVLGQKQDGSVFWHFQRKRYRQVPPRTNLTCFKTHISLRREISDDKRSAVILLVLKMTLMYSRLFSFNAITRHECRWEYGWDGDLNNVDLAKIGLHSATNWFNVLRGDKKPRWPVSLGES